MRPGGGARCFFWPGPEHLFSQTKSSCRGRGGAEARWFRDVSERPSTPSPLRKVTFATSCVTLQLPVCGSHGQRSSQRHSRAQDGPKKPRGHTDEDRRTGSAWTPQSKAGQDYGIELYLVHMHRHRNQMDRCSARGQRHRNPHLHRRSSDCSHRHRNRRGTLRRRGKD